MKKLIMGLVAVSAVIVVALYSYVLMNAPHMKEQPHVRAFQMEMPLPPQGTQTVQAPERLPSEAGAAVLKNPLPNSDDNRRRGNIYYHYYCVFCHGETGAGNGPVGESYFPAPADLRTGKIRQYPDGRLLRAMLTGIGHEPVLERVVPSRHRWYLVLYVRSAGAGGLVSCAGSHRR